MSSGDITFCGYNYCKNTDCERHSSHAKGSYNSFAYFEECPIHQKAREDLMSATSDIED